MSGMCLSDEDVVGYRERPADSKAEVKINPGKEVKRGQSRGKQKERGQKSSEKESDEV